MNYEITYEYPIESGKTSRTFSQGATAEEAIKNSGISNPTATARIYVDPVPLKKKSPKSRGSHNNHAVNAQATAHVTSILVNRGVTYQFGRDGGKNVIVLSNGNRLHVKGSTTGGSWQYNEEAEALKEGFEVVVDLSGEPVFYILPASITAKVLRESHAQHLAQNGQPTQRRSLFTDYSNYFPTDHALYGKDWMEQYKDAWCLLT